MERQPWDGLPVLMLADKKGKRMCKIIQFRVKNTVESNGFRNLKALFEICESVESCNFYLESAEQLHESGRISKSELYTLRRIGRSRRLKLATPVAEPQKVTMPGVYTYTPEMGQKKPA